MINCFEKIDLNLGQLLRPRTSGCVQFRETTMATSIDLDGIACPYMCEFRIRPRVVALGMRTKTLSIEEKQLRP
jgi:hypothetical protein